MDECALTPCPDCGKPRVPVQWCPGCVVSPHSELARLREENERLRTALGVVVEDTLCTYHPSDTDCKALGFSGEALCPRCRARAALETP